MSGINRRHTDALSSTLQAKHDTAETKGYVQGAVDTVVGGAKNIIGSVTGNTQQEGEGKAQQKGGDAQRAAN